MPGQTGRATAHAPRSARTRRPGAAAAAACVTVLVGLVGACQTPPAPAAPTNTTGSTSPPANPQPPADQPPPAPPAPATVRYVVTFDATWSRTTHPQEPPESPHFSPLIGGTHGDGVTFWQTGAQASAGIQRMAETGSISPLDQEVMAAVAAGDAEHLLSGDGVPDSPGVASFEFPISQSFPRVTLVTMVAPSPDWFAGVAGLALFTNAAWHDDVRVELFPYDAGTDSGPGFMSPDDATRPPVGIARILGFPFLVEDDIPSLGTFSFTRVP